MVMNLEPDMNAYWVLLKLRPSLTRKCARCALPWSNEHTLGFVKIKVRQNSPFLTRDNVWMSSPLSQMNEKVQPDPHTHKHEYAKNIDDHKIQGLVFNLLNSIIFYF